MNTEILIIKANNSSFISGDEKILSENYRAQSYLVGNKKGLAYFTRLLGLFFFMIRKGLFAKVYFLRFADYYAIIPAFFARLFGKDLVIVLGGYDAVHIPEYEYGVYHKPFRAFCARFAIRSASWILPNNPSLEQNINSYGNGSPRKEGIRYLVPRFNGKVRVIYNGFDANYWLQSPPGTERKKQVLTVAFVSDLKTYYLKGIDSFIRLAGKNPKTSFVIVGSEKSFLESIVGVLPDNLKVFSAASRDELKIHYYSSSVFCLLSLTEGMPNVLCEAMLCHCIPVGSAVNAIPEIIGDSGFLIEKQDESLMQKRLEPGACMYPGNGEISFRADTFPLFP